MLDSVDVKFGYFSATYSVTIKFLLLLQYLNWMLYEYTPL